MKFRPTLKYAKCENEKPMPIVLRILRSNQIKNYPWIILLII